VKLNLHETKAFLRSTKKDDKEYTQFQEFSSLKLEVLSFRLQTPVISKKKHVFR